MEVVLRGNERFWEIIGLSVVLLGGVCESGFDIRYLMSYFSREFICLWDIGIFKSLCVLKWMIWKDWLI